MSGHDLACWMAARLRAFNGNPLTIVLLVPLCAAFLAVGWWLGKVELFLLILTTVLSVDGSLAARVTTLAVDKTG